jgi:hypothetical protein
MEKSIIAVLMAVMVSVSACKKDEEDEMILEPTVPTVWVDLSHEVSGAEMLFNERVYETPAGNPYEVRHLEYYISDFKLLNQAGKWISVQSEPYLINPEKGRTRTLMAQVPVGQYKGISCMIGLPESKNVTGYLPNTLENVNMAWPDPIGGGYHFMKFEGNYLAENLKWTGFTVHLGTDPDHLLEMQSVNVITGIQFSISESAHQIELTMDMNEWFDTPHLYDFNIQGNYTMAIDSLMKVISENGENCLSFKN